MMAEATLQASLVTTAEQPAATVPRILIVDDQRAVRGFLSDALRASDLECEVQAAENGVVACMRLPRFRPDLVVLDVVMPELSGAEVCWAIKTSPSLARTKVLLMTGSPDDPRFEAALAAGADAWLVKPFGAGAFLAKVAELLGLQVPSPSGRG